MHIICEEKKRCTFQCKFIRGWTSSKIHDCIFSLSRKYRKHFRALSSSCMHNKKIYIFACMFACVLAYMLACMHACFCMCCGVTRWMIFPLKIFFYTGLFRNCFFFLLGLFVLFPPSYVCFFLEQLFEGGWSKEMCEHIYICAYM